MSDDGLLAELYRIYDGPDRPPQAPPRGPALAVAVLTVALAVVVLTRKASRCHG